jgi:FAD/FMN-containing dehydrogenase
MISKGKDGYYHPASEEEIRELIEHAAREGLKIRVRGAAHSVPAAIYTGDYERPPVQEKNINIFMDRMRAITYDEEHMQVTVQAGCHLGASPDDPTGTATVRASLLYQLDQKGWALPDTGGIIHQTVGGFLSTGSSGGSVSHSVGKSVVAIRLIDGTGQVHEFRKSDDPDDPFYAAGVSLGLLGIITSVTFQCVPNYNISGVETTSSYEKCAIDLFGSGNGKPSLEDYFRHTEHTRLMWFPQKGVEKIIVWQARQIERSPGFKRKHYHEFPTILGYELPAQILASILLRMFDVLNPPGPTDFVRRVLYRLLRPLYGPIVNSFLASAIKGPQKFQDTWWEGLPMDNRVNYTLMPTRFTELWFPVERSTEVMQTLLEHFRQGEFNSTGIYSCEIYCTPASDFWMSASYQRDVIKVDPFWFGYSRGNPDEVYFPKYWQLFREKGLDYRLHWGKALSDDVEYLRQQYPRWDDFMRLRDQMDPHQVFVTDYWRKHLGIPHPKGSADDLKH